MTEGAKCPHSLFYGYGPASAETEEALAAAGEKPVELVMAPTDPTNAERQRRLRERRKLGLEPVIVRGVSYSVPPKLAERIQKLCERARGAS